MAKTQRVAFGRINRRTPDQGELTDRSFAEDLLMLADSHLTEVIEPETPQTARRHWIAADMTLTPDGRFLTGTLGYSESLTHIDFNRDSWSWQKGEQRAADSGSEDTVVPFAIDTRDDNRWVAFATARRMQAPQVRRGLQLVLQEAVAQHHTIAAAWEVDLITSRAEIFAWLEENPRVSLLRRTVKFTNPGRNLDSDRRAMRALKARRLTEEFAAHPNRTLDTSSDEFSDLLEGVEEGNVDIDLTARSAEGGSSHHFTTRERPSTTFVDGFRDLHAGMDIVLRALRERFRRGPEQLPEGS